MTEDDIQDIIGSGWVQPYEYGYFDCSEMSSCLVEKLQSQGYNAKLCQSFSPTAHSWVAVVLDDRIITVEATTCKIIDYRKPQRVFQNVTDALEHGVPEDELDWRNVIALQNME